MFFYSLITGGATEEESGMSGSMLSGCRSARNDDPRASCVILFVRSEFLDDWRPSDLVLAKYGLLCWSIGALMLNGSDYLWKLAAVRVLLKVG